ncbi:hypothetical protein [Solicola sp. PLA-1-18]|uniref:hypothetical protein n=1 Tax=Solicola sp. PLA-1-18 TaxID=3380532 RepID=UPI003B7E144E
MVDNYATNPLADWYAEVYPERFKAVSAVKDPPKMFAGGTSDTPAFTASGIDPELLLKLPVGVRHAAAAEPDVLVLQRWFEEFAGLPEIEVDHEGLRSAKARLQDWMENTDLDTRTPEQRQADADAEYAAMFNPSNDRVAYAAENKRRIEAGEDELPRFGSYEMDRLWEQEAGASR